MAYITNNDIQERLGNQTYVQLTDDDGDGQADVGVVDEARLAAEGEVNSYLARRYQVPVDLAVHADLAGLLASVTLDLVEFRLRARRPPVSTAAVMLNARALDWLAAVAEGRLALPTATEVTGTTSSGPVAEARGSKRLLSREELSDH